MQLLALHAEVGGGIAVERQNVVRNRSVRFVIATVDASVSVTLLALLIQQGAVLSRAC